MKKSMALTLTLALTLLSLAGAHGPRPAPPTAAAEAGRPAPGLPGRYLVELSDATPRAEVPAAAARLAGEHGGEVTHVYRSVLHGFAVRLPDAGAAAALARDPSVARVEHDFAMTVVGSQSTPQVNSFYGIDRIDQPTGLSETFNYNRVGSGVHVYVLDTGVRTTHKEFGTRADTFADFVGGPLGNNHGTFVAGVIGAKNYGVAKNARIRSVRVCLNSGDCPASLVAAGLDHVVNHGDRPAVVNMSFAGRMPVNNVTLMETAVRNAINSGVTCVAGAGDGRRDPFSGAIIPEDASLYSPARMTELITVGATDKFDNRASYSNFGPRLDLFAPGGEGVAGQFIPSPSAASDTDIDGFTGTSASSPHVAGIAALYLEANPSAGHFQVRNAIVSNATPGVVANPGPGSPNLMAYAGFVPPPASDPLDDQRFFVRQQYYDVLRRQPEPTGWDDWTNFILGCGGDAACLNARRITTARGFYESPEFRDRFPALRDNPENSPAYNEEYVRQLFVSYLQRDPDPGGFSDWLNYINTHPGDYDTLVAGFINSHEYRVRFR